MYRTPQYLVLDGPTVTDYDACEPTDHAVWELRTDIDRYTEVWELTLIARLRLPVFIVQLKL